MTAFDQAWDVAKAPIWTDDTATEEAGFPKEDLERFPDLNILSRLRAVGMGRVWESDEGDARGFATFHEGKAPDDPKDPYHQISHFEIAEDQRGKGLLRERLREMIAELSDEDGEYSTHVTHSESHTADLWDKLVDEGLIDSASTKPYVTTTPEGRLLPYTKNRSE
jgi:GNAT superfamily N-acetyltransferase